MCHRKLPDEVEYNLALRKLTAEADEEATGKSEVVVEAK